MINGLQPAFPLCMQPNDTQDAAAGYQKERKHGAPLQSHDHHPPLTSQKDNILNRIKMGCDDDMIQFFHLKENSMKNVVSFFLQ
jgi:hypothetical protein